MNIIRVIKYQTVLNEDRICTLIKENSINYTQLKSIKEAGDAVKLVNDLYSLSNQTEEVLYLLCLDTQNKTTGTFELSRGTVNTSLVSPRVIFMKAVLCNAVSIIMVHNHPSGDPKPSKKDTDTTDLIKLNAELMGINLIDHIIVGDSSYYSMKGDNLL